MTMLRIFNPSFPPYISEAKAKKKDARFLVCFVRQRGITKYKLTQYEYERLRRKAIKLQLDAKAISEFDKSYEFIQRLARKMRLGAINSMTGMCFMTAVSIYATTAKLVDNCIYP